MKKKFVTSFFVLFLAFLNNPIVSFANTVNYNSGTGHANIDNALLKIIRMVAGAGASALTLAVLVITLIIIFGSISAQKMRTVWMSLISCLAGAFIFFSAYMFAPAIQAIASGTP